MFSSGIRQAAFCLPEIEHAAMGRPRKNDADYFPHDKDMRNNPKVRAIRQKHGLEGYAVWCMLIETLTDCDNFVLSVDDITIEVLSGDFGIEQDVLSSLLQSFRRLKLIQYDEQELYAPGLLERMEPLLNDRARKRAWAAKSQNSEHHENQTSTGFSTSKSPQSKVKESKVKESISTSNSEAAENKEEKKPESPKDTEKGAAPGTATPLPKTGYEPVDPETELDQMLTDYTCEERFFRQCHIPLDQFPRYIEDFRLKVRSEQAIYPNKPDFRSHFFNWSSKQFERSQKQSSDAKFKFRSNDTITDALEFAEQWRRENELGLPH